ncbi:phage head-tail connector protein [Virgibacillus salexigens]|uniref:phage head-tail connector protein n=1 Tax=Virgibacillus salexigens TaxID=61016 RepID=UPI00190C31A3|nr:phage head-tail connector protein [Virgibacillus salexigens]
MVTLEQFKNATGIKNKDEQVEALIPIVENHIKGICNIKEVPPDYDINAIKMIEYQLNTKAGYTSESLSRHSVSYANAYPEECTKGLRRRLRW